MKRKEIKNNTAFLYGGITAGFTDRFAKVMEDQNIVINNVGHLVINEPRPELSFVKSQNCLATTSNSLCSFFILERSVL